MPQTAVPLPAPPIPTSSHSEEKPAEVKAEKPAESTPATPKTGE